MADLIVTAPLVQLKTKAGTYVHVYGGSPVPENADAKHVAELEKLGMVGKAEAPASTTKEPTVPEILAEVGDDVDKAKAALVAEVEARGDKARKGLVEKLEAVIAAAEGSQG